MLHYDDTGARPQPGARSQAVWLPKEYRFAGTEVMVKHFGNGVLLLVTNNTREFAKVPG